MVVGPHPHDLYLALSALGVIRNNDPLRRQLPWGSLDPHDRYLALSALGVIRNNDPLSHVPSFTPAGASEADTRCVESG
jgi:hypothetical protein